MLRFGIMVALVGLAACSKSDKTGAPPPQDDRDRDNTRTTTTGTPPKGSGAITADPGSAHRGIALDLDGDLEIPAGAIGKDVVRKVVKDNTSKLQACYEKTLLVNPSIEGKLVATFTIAAEGSVTDVKASGVHPDVESCVVETVKAFKFPPSGKKVDVSYPFTFKPA